MKTFLILVTLTLCGCSIVHPVAEVSHVSSILQHFDGAKNIEGYNTVSLGANAKLGPVNFTVLDGYTPETLNYRHEVFQARLTVDLMGGY